MNESFDYIALRQKALERRFSNMNPMQREAVFQVQGPLLILAGAGSGKTTVVINRIAGMVKFGDAYASAYVPSDLTEDGARALGYRRLYLETHTNLTAACRMYEKLGFSVIDRPAGVQHGTMNRFYLKEL